MTYTVTVWDTDYTHTSEAAIRFAVFVDSAKPHVWRWCADYPQANHQWHCAKAQHPDVPVLILPAGIKET